MAALFDYANDGAQLRRSMSTRRISGAAPLASCRRHRNIARSAHSAQVCWTAIDLHEAGWWGLVGVQSVQCNLYSDPRTRSWS